MMLRWRYFGVSGADRDRTGDPLLAKQVLSQLSYRPEVTGAANLTATLHSRPSLHLHLDHLARAHRALGSGAYGDNTLVAVATEYHLADSVRYG
jgi:hypothetical protein